ncbi:MAG TPA: uroporphyrinogen decarboxylase family protein [Anaerolineae bacterium]|nr:uroporphyrinogen decarboxylase family protein [Anaerolineae bacterium]HOQ99859.1 uroporphyrinogen decarboxylase family protein [Anaerolineae bacterium]HPL28216.1 uroporphyrinogen decarboxylase family protein [Anaerolineae bacterium]
MSDVPDARQIAFLRDRVMPLLDRVAPAAIPAVMARALAGYLAPVPTPAGLTSAELVRRAIEFAGPARIPYAAMAPMVGDFFELTIPAVVMDDRRRLGIPRRPGEVAYDEWGVGNALTGRFWNQAVAHPLAGLQGLDGYRLPPLAAPRRYRWAGPLIRRANAAGKYVVAPDPVCLGERARLLVGFEDVMVAAYADRSRLSALLGRLADLTIACVEQWRRQGHVHAFMTWDDWGLQTAPMVSPALFREVWAPHYARIIEAVHRAGMHHIWHCCGQIADLIPSMLELGSDVLQIDQPRLLGHAQMAARFGGRACFWNAVDVQWSPRPDVTLQEIDAEVQEMVRVLGAFGGGLMLRHYPQPWDIDLSAGKAEAIYRAFLRHGGDIDSPVHPAL